MREEGKFTWKQFKEMVGPSFLKYGGYYGFVVCLIVISSLSQVAEPIIFGRIVDRLFVGGEDLLSQLWVLLGLWVGAFLTSILMSQLAQLLGWWVGHHVSNHFVHRSLRMVLYWDADRFGRESSGALAKRIDQAWDKTFDISGRTITDVLPILVTFVCVFAGGLFLDWRMTLAALVMVPFAAFMTLVVYRNAEKKQDKLMEAWEGLSSRIQETLNNILPIKIFAGEQRVEKQQVEAINEVTTRQITLNSLWAWLGAGNGVIRLGSRMIVLIVGVYLIADRSLTVGTLVTFLGMLNYILAPFDYVLGDILRRTGEARTAYARLAKDWFEANQITEVARPLRLKTVKGEIVYDGVRYRYPAKKEDALNDIKLTVEVGSSLAIVGRSGSGKSTFVKFLNRFLDPTEGTVRIDGVDVRGVKIEDLRKAVGIVQQDTVLFNESIYENIRFAKPGASRAQVIAACKKAQAHDFIMKLPKKYDTVVGERGVKLSGGERQRISLARVFLASPPILVLDESTSALDSETEHKLQEALKEAMRGRTTIIIAHRLSTVYMADQIVVLEQGKIVEKGSHSELLKHGGVYERLWKLQSGGYLPE